MNKISIIALGLLFIQVSAKGQEVNSQQQTGVRQALINLYAGEAGSDLKIIKLNCTANFLMLRDSTVWDINLLAAKLLNPVPKTNQTNALTFMKVHFKGKNAWVSYHNTMCVTAADGVKSVVNREESAVLVKSKNRWLVSQLYSKTQKS